MKTQYQFLMVSSPPAKEHAFQKAKSLHGSTYAFQLVELLYHTKLHGRKY